jgi:hypothetical protein
MNWVTNEIWYWTINTHKKWYKISERRNDVKTFFEVWYRENVKADWLCIGYSTESFIKAREIAEAHAKTKFVEELT